MLTTESRAPSGTPGRRGGPVVVLVPSLVVGLVSAAMSPSYDEVYWLAVVRKLAGGGRLYDTVIDNKGPLWYPLFSVSDLLPVPFWVSRSLLMAITSLVLYWLARRLLSHLPRRGGDLLAGLVVVLTAAFSFFHLTPELFATVPLLASLWLSQRHHRIAALGLFAAVLIDPRVAVLVPGVVWYQIRSNPFSERSAHRGAIVAAAIATGVALTPYVALEDLRFAVIEVGQATRAGVVLDVGAALTVLTTASIAFAAILYLMARPMGLRLEGPAVVFAVGAAVIAVASIAPFPHYWTYLPIALTMLSPAPVRSSRPRLAFGLVAAALLPLLVLAYQANREDRLLAETYDPALETIASDLPSDHQVVLFVGDPHPAARFPDRTLGSAPVSFYLGMETSRKGRFHLEFQTGLAQADAIWVVTTDREIDRSPLPQLAEEWRMVEARLPSFPCNRFVYPLLVLEREQPSGGCREWVSKEGQ